MANRNTLPSSAVEEFKKWLGESGWAIEKTKDYYEVVRARRGKRTLIVYQRLGEHQHLTLQDKDVGVAKSFLKEMRHRKEADENAG